MALYKFRIIIIIIITNVCRRKFCSGWQIFDKFSMSGSSKPSEKLTEMLSESDTSPAAQERLKVAFAEGYLASDKKKTDPEANWSALPRRILRFGLVILMVWLSFQLLQTYSALGGSTLNLLPFPLPFLLFSGISVVDPSQCGGPVHCSLFPEGLYRSICRLF